MRAKKFFRTWTFRLALTAGLVNGGFYPSICRASQENSLEHSLVAPGDFWQQDKIEHASISAGISAATYGFLRSRGFSRWESFTASIGLCLAIGAGKEVFDPRVDLNDIKADIAGGVVGTSFSFTIDVIAF